MGLFFSKLYKLIQSNSPCRILMIGLDWAGKTTMLNRFVGEESKTTAPTIGFNVETVDYKNLTFNVFDVGGLEKIRPLWRCYFYSAQGIIYVVDSKDSSRLEEAKEELHSLLECSKEQNCPVLVYANKQGSREAVSPDGVSDALDLMFLGSRPWHVQGCCAINGTGVFEGLDWLASNIKS
ncbi:UNVERIFIED_CONTAM: hypothetical protein RMT77_018870 [Armadillidium vulgare]